MSKTLLDRLLTPAGPIDAVLDTDAYNEIDDQFAIAYLLRSADRIHTEAIYAAPFHNAKSTGPENGMELSYNEILHIVALAGREDIKERVFRGSRAYLPDEKTPVPSEACDDLIARALRHSADEPLYVLAIGVITNVASAILKCPDIIDRIVIVWLGGHALGDPDTREFNMKQDFAAARVVFGCGAALVQLPCRGVVEQLRTTAPELIHWLRGKNALCDYLCDNTIREAESYAAGKPWSRVIWDISTVAWLRDTAGKGLSSYLIPAPIPEYDGHYSLDPTRHPMRYVWHISRDWVFEDLFRLLTQ